MNVTLPWRRRSEALVLGRTGPFYAFPHVCLSEAERATHMYILGITGQGKSKLLEWMLYQDILAGRGCGLLDPHTDLAHDLLGGLAQKGFFRDKRNRERFIYFDPSRPDTVIPFNVLNTGNEPYHTAVHLIEAFRRTWPESLREAPRFTNILLASLLVLIHNHLTLVELPRLLTDRKFREGLLENVDDVEIVSVFHDRLDRWGREQPLILESILNKVSAFTLNPILRRILGAGENHLDFRQIMDEGKVFIADLGRCDGETRRLLGSLIVTGIEQAALSRKDEPSRARRPFYFYVDEFQDFSANEGSAITLAQILSESRKFGLHLTLAHQTLGQMDNAHLVSALGNVGVKAVFAVDRADAEIMVKKLFAVDSERVKHEVPDEAQQERTHPVFYSLQEAWEQAIQQIQALPPRSFLVKVPRRPVARVHTIFMPPSRVMERDLEAIRVSLVRPWGAIAASSSGKGRGEENRQGLEFTYYEPVEHAARMRVRPQ
jgi:hypothetical protein